MLLFLTFMFACGENNTNLQCADDVLQECDAEGICTDVQDCAADGQICHDMGDDSHCMNEGAMDEGAMDDSGMEM